jgi:hypothetical protein
MEFTLGAIKLCAQGQTIGVCYFGADGSQHIFSRAETGDGSQLLLSGSGPYDMWTATETTTPSAGRFRASTIRTRRPRYIRLGRGRDGWYLTSVTPTRSAIPTRRLPPRFPCWTYRPRAPPSRRG